MKTITCPICERKILDNENFCAYCKNIFIQEKQENFVEKLLNYDMSVTMPLSNTDNLSHNDTVQNDTSIVHEEHTYVTKLKYATNLMQNNVNMVEKIHNLMSDILIHKLAKNSESGNIENPPTTRYSLSDAFTIALSSLYSDEDPTSTISYFNSIGSSIKDTIASIGDMPSGLDKYYNIVSDLSEAHTKLIELITNPTMDYADYSNSTNHAILAFKSIYNAIAPNLEDENDNSTTESSH